MKTRSAELRETAKCIALVLLLLVLLVPPRTQAVGSWAPQRDLTPGAANGGLPPGPVSLMLLLSDGTVLAQDSFGTGSYRLSPDIHGSYVNGSWTTLSPMKYPRLFYSSAMLRDGRVFVAGGEYSQSVARIAGGRAEVFDPVHNMWTEIPVPGGLLDLSIHTLPDGTQTTGFSDSPCGILPDGTILVAPNYPATNGLTIIFDPRSNTISPGPQLTNGARSTAEQSWVKLPDASILTIDSDFHSQRYIPSLNQWIPDQDLPVQLYVAAEIGAGLLLPKGRAFFLGGSGHTAFYAPSGSTAPGSWSQGPEIPNGLVAADAPAAMMVNGKILCAFTSANNHKPVFFFEYDPFANSFAPAPSTTNPTIGSPDGFINSDQTSMLALPDGSVLFSHRENRLYIYRPDPQEFPLTSWKPIITAITPNGDGSYHLTGKQLNGLSSGAAFGDDAQMDSNYPLVRLADDNNNLYYARTYNWSSTGVQTGDTPVTTEFTPPYGLLNPGTYSLVVVANGISSDPVSFSGPVWVDFNVPHLPPFLEDGSYIFPYWALAHGTNGVPDRGTILIRGPSSTTEAITITKPLTMIAVGGTVSIGRR